MKGDEIPTTDHVALHCPRTVLEWGKDGNPCGLKIDAFHVDDDGISVNWLEYEPGSFEECFERICRLFASVLTLRESHRCAVMNVHKIKQTAADCGKNIKVVHDPVVDPPPNPAHSLIIGCAANAPLLQQFTLLVDLWPFSAAALKTSKEKEKQKKKKN